MIIASAGSSQVPGIHFVHGRQGESHRGSFQAALNGLLHDDHYRAEVLCDNEATRLAVTRYPEYPVSVWEDEEFLIVLEGRIYGLPESLLRKDLNRLAQLITAPKSPEPSRVAEWLLDHDGDYLIVVHNKRTSAWALVNDALGRLPVYHGRSDRIDIVSREIKFIAATLPQVRMDRMGLAANLLFGSFYGRLTLLDKVDRLPPATLLRWDHPNARAQQQVLNQLDYDEREPDVPIGEFADRLVALFLQACRHRAGDDDELVVSLSGGLDSRSVAAGLQRIGRDFHAMTFEDARGHAARDVAVARELAAKLDLDWKLVELSNPTGRDLRRKLLTKGGMSYVAQAFGALFLAEIAERFGRGIIFLTGDGGDGTLPYLIPPPTFSTASDVAHHFVNRYGQLPPSVVADLTGVRPDDIIEAIAAQVESYPERSLKHRYIHLLGNARRRRWLYEGEDSNRLFFWTCSPFYDLSFYTACMHSPDAYRKDHRLYAEFLKRLSPAAADVPDANRSVAVTSSAYVRKLHLIARLNRFPRLASLARKILRPQAHYTTESAIIECLKEQVAHSPSVAEYLDPTALGRLLDQGARISQDNIDNLFTVTSAIEFLTGADLALDRFLDREF